MSVVVGDRPSGMKMLNADGAGRPNAWSNVARCWRIAGLPNESKMTTVCPLPVSPLAYGGPKSKAVSFPRETRQQSTPVRGAMDLPRTENFGRVRGVGGRPGHPAADPVHAPGGVVRLDANGEVVLQNAVADGAAVTSVNIMAFSMRALALDSERLPGRRCSGSAVPRDGEPATRWSPSTREPDAGRS